MHLSGGTTFLTDTMKDLQSALPQVLLRVELRDPKLSSQAREPLSALVGDDGAPPEAL